LIEKNKLPYFFVLVEPQHSLNSAHPSNFIVDRLFSLELLL
jgi:hypothetical protein